MVVADRQKELEQLVQSAKEEYEEDGKFEVVSIDLEKGAVLREQVKFEAEKE
ncbi:hypothetical protein HC928_02575 [bacterium]|nr:hypothetical protein [bacterium]